MRINPDDVYLLAPSYHVEMDESPILIARLDFGFFTAIDKYAEEIVPFMRTMSKKDMPLASVDVPGTFGSGFADANHLVFPDEHDLESIRIHPIVLNRTVRDRWWRDGMTLEEALDTEPGVIFGSDLFSVFPDGLPDGEFDDGEGLIRTEIDLVRFFLWSGAEDFRIGWTSVVKHTDVSMETLTFEYPHLKALYYGRSYETHQKKLKEYKTILTARGDGTWIRAAEEIPPCSVDAIVAELKELGETVAVEPWKP